MLSLSIMPCEIYVYAFEMFVNSVVFNEISRPSTEKNNMLAIPPTSVLNLDSFLKVSCTLCPKMSSLLSIYLLRLGLLIVD